MRISRHLTTTRKATRVATGYLDTSFVAATQSLDPLDFDHEISTVISANKASEIRALSQLLQRMVEAARHVNTTSSAVIASVRDLGIVMGSIRRLGEQPAQLCPELTQVLSRWTAIHHMIPRDTVYHYTLWNPEGVRRRRYTDNDMELHLIAAVSHALPDICAAVDRAFALSEAELDDVTTALTVSAIALAAGRLVHVIDEVLANVTGSFFATQLRPFFEPVVIGDVEYFGPAAAHVPVALLDLCLWASDASCEEYASFWRTSSAYGLPGWATRAQLLEQRPSLTTRLSRHHGDPASPTVISCAEAMARSLRALLEFRAKHLKLAKAAYDPALTHLQKGSGGETISFLESVVELTKANRDAVKRMLGTDRAHAPQAV